jgi:Uma2 family endonuclease
MSHLAVSETEVAPSTADEDALYEIVDDLRVGLPAMGARAYVIAFKLASKIEQFAEGRELGQAVTEALFRLRSRPNLQGRPDAAFVSFERWAKGQDDPTDNAWDVIPDLAVEVVSPTNHAEEIPTKVREYFEAGVRRVWVIYPHEFLVYEYDSPRSIRVLGTEDALEGGTIIPGFRLPLADLLRRAEST